MSAAIIIQFIFYAVCVVFIIILAHITIIPLKISGTTKPSEKLYAKIAVSWGLVRIRAEIVEGMILHLRFSGLLVVKKPVSELRKEKEPQIREEIGEKEETKESAVDLHAILSLKDDILRLLREITFGHFHLKLRFGLDDAADTGILYGFLMALRGAAYAEKRVVINAYPAFEGFVFEPDCTCEFLVKRVYRTFLPIFKIFRTVSKKPKKSVSGVL